MKKNMVNHQGTKGTKKTINIFGLDLQHQIFATLYSQDDSNDFSLTKLFFCLPWCLGGENVGGLS
jgi:hypothetical protein